jgi:hypothetical protein
MTNLFRTTYGKPDGWTLTMQAIIEGELWECCVDCGVDASRSRPWAVVVEPPASGGLVVENG